MPRIVALVALAVVLVALAGCDLHGPGEPPAPERTLLPLGVGDAWVFGVTRSYPEADSTRPTSPGDTLRVVGEVEHRGRTWAELRSSRRALDQCLGGFYAVIDGDVWFSRDLTDAEPARLYAREPAYRVRTEGYDASVRAERDRRRWTYTFDLARVRGRWIQPSGEAPLPEASPDLTHAFELDLGFRRYDQMFYRVTGDDAVEVAYIDTWTLLDFLPGRR